MQFDVLTLFPEMFEILNESIIGRAKEKGLINVNLINIRDFSKDKHKKVDDTPYGGGAGMVMMPDVVYDAYKSVKDKNAKVIYMSPKGKKLDQKKVEELSKEEYCFAYSPTYTKKEIETIRDLSQFKILLPIKNSVSRKKLDDTLFKYDLTIEPTMELENSEIIMNYIKEGMGIGYIPGTLVDDSLIKAKITEPLPVEVINLVYNEKALTVSSKSFIELLENK